METQVIIDELARASQSLKEDQLQGIIDKIRSHGRIFVYGTGRSGLMLKTFAMRLMQLGMTAYVVGETTTPSIGSGDLLIVASASGTTASVCMTAEAALKDGAALCVITASPESPLAKLQKPDIIIRSATKFATSDASIQPLGSLFEQMLLVVFDSLVLRMSQAHSGSNDAMASWHANLE